MFFLSLPYLLAAILVVAAVLFICRRWRIACGVLVCAFVLNIWCECFSFGRLFPRGHRCDLRVMCYNVHGGGDGYDLDGLVCAIDECDPDVVYVGERPIYGKELYDKLVDRYGGNVMSFQEEIVAGKLPLDSRVELIRFSGGNVQQIYMCVSDLWISVSCCHMSSNNYQSGKYVTPDSLETVHGLRRYVANIDTVSLKRTECAEKIGETIDPCCMGPTIVMGDMNDVARSPALEVFRRYGLKDAWWRGGFGYGATIHKPLPFRIDHILYGGGLKLVSCKKIKSKGRGKDGRPLSDHDGLVAEFEIVR